MTGLCLMQVHAHPDDEASKGAGVAARYAGEGVRTVLVTCTGGEAGEILNPAADSPEARANLKAVRLAELEESAKILGYSSVHLLGYRDSGMPDSADNAHPEAFANADFDEAVARLVALIREERPNVIITYGDDQSSYPHPDHLRCHDITVVAFDAAGAPGRFPDAGEPWQPQKLYYLGWTMRGVRALHEAILALGKESPYGDRIESWGTGSDERYTTRIDVRGALRQRREALLAHRTQIEPGSFWFALDDEQRAAAYPWEELILARSLIETHVPEGEFEEDLFAGLR